MELTESGTNSLNVSNRMSTTNAAYRECGATVHQVGPDGELSLSWRHRPARALFGDRVRAQAQMFAVHPQARVKHVGLHHYLHRVRVALDRHRPRPQVELRALRPSWGPRVAACPGRAAGRAGASAVRQPALRERRHGDEDDNPPRRGRCLRDSLHPRTRASRFGERTAGNATTGVSTSADWVRPITHLVRLEPGFTGARNCQR